MPYISLPKTGVRFKKNTLYNTVSHYRKTCIFEYLTYFPRPISIYKIPKKKT